MTERTDRPPEGGGEPRGTLAVVAIFGALVLLGWLALFFGLFVPRGTH